MLKTGIYCIKKVKSLLASFQVIILYGFVGLLHAGIQ